MQREILLYIFFFSYPPAVGAPRKDQLL